MKKIIDYLKDKIYYILAATVLIIVILVIINACSNGSGNDYEDIENDMVNAAKEYYQARKNRLPKEDDSTVEVSIGTLIDAELIDEITDPKDSSQTCSGHVEVTKVGKDYSYTPFLTCKGNYEPKYLTDIIKDVKTDEYGNGVYKMGDELVYRGDDVNNYVSFNNQLWRIVKVDSEGDIKLVSAVRTEESYAWDDAYNSERESEVGITADYLHTNIRKVLNDYYEENFTTDSKAKIVSKDLCVGKYAEQDEFSVEKECSIKKEDEKIGLLNLMDYKNASLDSKCTKLSSNECSNYNYLANTEEFNTWTLNSSSIDTYRVYYIFEVVKRSNASNTKRFNPVVYLTSDVIISDGNGTSEKPYIVK